MRSQPGIFRRLTAFAICGALVAQPALAGITDIANVPLASSGGSSVLPNLLFDLDASGSMAWDFNPDYMYTPTSGLTGYPCMKASSSSSLNCTRGDPPYEAGGAHAANGVSYDPMLTYAPGVNYDGSTVLAEPLSTTATPNDAYGVQDTGTTNLTSAWNDYQFCNASSSPKVCKRNGADTSGNQLPAGTDPLGNPLAAGQFPYRANRANSSTVNFGLPEMMAIGSFTRSSSTVTGTTVTPHGLTTSNTIYVSTGTTGIDGTCMTVATVPTTTTFTYASPSGSGSISAKTGGYRVCASATWSRPSSGTTAQKEVVTVTSTGHGLVTNDSITVKSDDPLGSTSGTFTITVVDANNFTYTTTAIPTNTSGNVSWVRTGLYNVRSSTAGAAVSYSITPIEYCSDINLTNCVEVIPPSTPPAGYFPAYVRWCQSQAYALANGAVTGNDANGNSLCRAKYVNSGVLSVTYLYARYGWFNRDTIQSSVNSYKRSAARADCANHNASTPTCSYNEEIQNFAHWWAYYQTRMQTMKSAAGRAFLSFIGAPTATPSRPDTLRLGFIIINPGSTVGSSEYLRIDNFNSTNGSSSQAANWFSKFYGQNPNNSTPLREAVSRAGWIFAGKLNTGLTSGIPATDDPIQASCQKNFHILTTDGFWNGNGGQTLAGKSIGNYDNADPTFVSPYTPPMVDRATTAIFDGGGATSTTVTPTSTINEQVVCLGSAQTNFSNNTSASPQNTGCGCATGQHKIVQRNIATGTSVTYTEGVQTGTGTATITTFQDVTSCSTALTNVTTTPITETEEVVCQGNATTAFSNGGNGGGGQTTCGCGAGSLTKQVMQRVITYNKFSTTYDGGSATITYGPNLTQTFTAAGTNGGACSDQTANQTTTGATITEDMVCTGSGTVTFADGSTFTCSCSTGAYERVHENRTNATITQPLVDGSPNGPATVSGGTTTRTYCKSGCNTTPPNSGSSWVSSPYSGSGCTTTSSSAATSVAQAISGGSTSTTGTSGTTVTSAMFDAIVKSPNTNPRTVAGTATGPVTSGAALTIALSPNPKTVSGGQPVTTTNPGGTANTLADATLYYYMTDLRGGVDVNGDTTGPSKNLGGTGTVDVSTNNVPTKTGAVDFVTHQHMVTFTIGLADGLMRYQSDYDTATNGDFYNIKQKTLAGCFWSGAAYCDWPAPAADDPSALDDLWHAAVNGRGLFFQATNAAALSTGLQNALTAVNAQVAAAAASATSSPNITQTSNQIFSTTYETSTWSGKVFAQTIDPATGNVNATHQWDADTLLVNKVSASSDTRSIWTWSGSGTTNLKALTWANLTATQQGYFASRCNPTTLMTQCSQPGFDTTSANDGSRMLAYLRGAQQDEALLYRDRTFIDPTTNAVVNTVLGDTITAKPAYIANPTFAYQDAVTPTYATFASTNANRASRIYVGANDGFLHAFDANPDPTQGGGSESWAYVPSFLMPAMYQLADFSYAAKHRFFVDGSPELSDVFDTTAGAWKTILVAGVGGGGRGYYALDITDPANPKGLWEFCNDSTLCALNDANLGLTYGNPVIGKRKSDGRWVVVLTSGLNNTSSGDGVGRFYVLDAITGAILNTVSTGVGSTSTPSGLMKMSGLFPSANTDATFEFIYAGDQLGNVWRLDLGSSTSAGGCAAPASSSATPPCVTHLATLTDNSSPPLAQPITTRPSLTHVSTVTYPIVYIATGRYLGDGTHGGLSDLSQPASSSGVAWLQTIYALKDKNVDYDAGKTTPSLRADATLVQQVLTQSTPTESTITSNPVDWTVKDGWYVDLSLNAGERVNVDPRLVLGTLVLVSNIPATGGSCSVGGSSVEYDLDFQTGSAVATSTGGVVGRSLGGTIAVGMAIVELPSGAIKDIVTGADTSKTTTAVNVSASASSLRRFSYRER